MNALQELKPVTPVAQAQTILVQYTIFVITHVPLAQYTAMTTLLPHLHPLHLVIRVLEHMMALTITINSLQVLYLLLLLIFLQYLPPTLTLDIAQQMEDITIKHTMLLLVELKH
jgi:hypothetical protein